jgi:hypothetical protein
VSGLGGECDPKCLCLRTRDNHVRAVAGRPQPLFDSCRRGACLWVRVAGRERPRPKPKTGTHPTVRVNHERRQAQPRQEVRADVFHHADRRAG